MISDRTKKALAAAKARDMKLGGIRHHVIGVDKDGKKIYGEQVLNVSSKTRALRAIAAGLNDAGIPTARGGEWSAI